MDRGRLHIVGIDDDDHPIATTLRSAGYAVGVSPRPVSTEKGQEPQVVLVMGKDLLSMCRSARNAYPQAQVIACMTRDEDQATGELMAAGLRFVSVVFESELLGAELGLPRPVVLGLSRLARDLLETRFGKLHS